MPVVSDDSDNVRLCYSCLFLFGENGGNLYVQ